ncbi:MAG: hypothetical protein ACRD8O_24635 [Bryobacteraceae bacterium]
MAAANHQLPGAGSVPAPFPLPPTFPPGVNPETYQIDAVHALLKEAAYFPILSIPDLNNPDAPIPSPFHAGRLIGVHVNERPHRFEFHEEAPGAGLGLRSSHVTGESIAQVHMQWMPCPDNWDAAPGIVPPPTELDVTRSQRFVMLNGSFTFDDRDHSGIRAFGAGRTFPTMVNGSPQLGLGSVIEILEGFGKLEGMHGVNVVNGYIDPPFGMMLCFMLRIVDPHRRLQPDGSSFPPLEAIPDPAPGTAIIVLLGETDPGEPVTLNFAPGGTMLGSNVTESLRLVRINYDIRGRRGIRSHLNEGPIVGKLQGTLHFNPLDPRPSFPIFTTNGRLSFFDHDGRDIGSLFANIDEGTAFRTELCGAPMPVFRFGGYGAFSTGTGQFAGINGMMTLNAAVSVFPRTLSNMYILRINDPDGRFRSGLCDAWL